MGQKSSNKPPYINPRIDYHQKQQELILKAAKEIVVKFIELGKVSPDTFDEVFSSVYQTISETIKENK